MPEKDYNGLFDDLGREFLAAMKEHGTAGASESVKVGAMMYLGFRMLSGCLSHSQTTKGNGVSKTWVAVGTAIGAGVASALLTLFGRL